MILFYGYKKCSTCRKAEKALEEAGTEYAFVDITEAPPGKAALKALVQQSGLELKRFFNTSGEQYKALGMKDKVNKLSSDSIVALLSGNGRLLKRPIVTNGRKTTVGFDPVAFPKTWS